VFILTGLVLSAY